MSDVDKLIADAEAVTNGDDARIDVMITRMEELASLAADTIHTGLLGIEGVRAQHGIEAIAGLAWLVGRLAAFADYQSGNTRTASMATIGLMIQGGYDEWVATKDP